jgi:two-component system response regulator YesN
MPGKNGIDVMREAEEAGAAPVFAILSGYDEFAYAQQALRYGAKEYPVKTRAGSGHPRVPEPARRSVL